ncbi:MAG: ferritin family protein [Deltaproteobacteria bacterium]|nr:ferritin family protein [Deltaproteobacteria bacterium]
MFSIRDIFELGEQLERNGRDFYTEALAGFQDPRLQSLLQWLADEEVKHEEWFSRRKAALGEGEGDVMTRDMGNAILREVLGDQTFSLKDADLSKIGQIRDLVDIALEFEKDTILFFEMIQSFLEDPETIEGLKAIIEEERLHIRKIEEYGGVAGAPKVP